MGWKKSFYILFIKCYLLFLASLSIIHIKYILKDKTKDLKKKKKIRKIQIQIYRENNRRNEQTVRLNS